MKKITIFGEIYEAEKIIKSSTSIVGYNGDTEVFAFRGISDFSVFQLSEGDEWDIDEKIAGDAYLLDLDFRLSLLELGCKKMNTYLLCKRVIENKTYSSKEDMLLKLDVFLLVNRLTQEQCNELIQLLNAD